MHLLQKHNTHKNNACHNEPSWAIFGIPVQDKLIGALAICFKGASNNVWREYNDTSTNVAMF